MALLEDAIEAKKFDLRLVEKKISRGLMKRSELDAQLKTLSDDEANAEWVSSDKENRSHTH